MQNSRKRRERRGERKGERCFSAMPPLLIMIVDTCNFPTGAKEGGGSHLATTGRNKREKKKEELNARGRGIEAHMGEGGDAPLLASKNPSPPLEPKTGDLQTVITNFWAIPSPPPFWRNVGAHGRIEAIAGKGNTKVDNCNIRQQKILCIKSKQP